MKFYELTKEEEAILKDVEAGKYVRIKNFEKAKKEAIAAARNTLNKSRNINIRLSERDLSRLKRRAAEEGLPYQTLASSIIHRSVDN